MAELNFYWRMGDYALEACPQGLVWSTDDEPNVTIDFVKYYRWHGQEFKYSIGYFWWDDNEPCWELKFVGARFMQILDGDAIAIFKMLKAAYETLDEWKKRTSKEAPDEG